MKGFTDFKTLYCRNKNINAAVRQVDFFDNTGNRSYPVKVCHRRIFSFIFEHDNSDKAVLFKSGFRNLNIVIRSNHKRGKNTRKNRPPLQRNKS